MMARIRYIRDPGLCQLAITDIETIRRVGNRVGNRVAIVGATSLDLRRIDRNRGRDIVQLIVPSDPATRCFLPLQRVAKDCTEI